MKYSARRSKVINIVFYGLGVLLLAYVIISGSENITQAIVLLFFYLSMLIFSRYLQRHGGMGWQWPA